MKVENRDLTTSATSGMTPCTGALIGVEHPHARRHLRTLVNLKEVERILLWGETPAGADEARSGIETKPVEVIAGVDELLRRGPDFAVACVRNDQSERLCLQVLEAGIPLLAEKPIGRTAAEVGRVVAAADKSGVPFGVLYINRYHPVVEKAREIAATGLLGPLLSMDMRLATSQVRYRDPTHWLHDRSVAGGGIISWLGCHYLDMIRFVTGDEVMAVAAGIATRSGEAISAEDVASITMRFRSGAIGSFAAGYVLCFGGAGYEKSVMENSFSFNGREGRLVRTGAWRLHAECAHSKWAAEPHREYVFEPSTSDSYGRDYGERFVRDFLRSISDGIAPPASGHDALQIARIVDAAYISAATGRWIDVSVGS